MRERSRERDKQLGGRFGRSVRYYPTITSPVGPDRRASDRYAERQCNDGVTASWCAAISRLLGMVPPDVPVRAERLGSNACAVNGVKLKLGNQMLGFAPTLAETDRCSTRFRFCDCRRELRLE